MYFWTLNKPRISQRTIHHIPSISSNHWPLGMCPHYYKEMPSWVLSFQSLWLNVYACLSHPDQALWLTVSQALMIYISSFSLRRQSLTGKVILRSKMVTFVSEYKTAIYLTHWNLVHLRHFLSMKCMVKLVIRPEMFLHWQANITIITIHVLRKNKVTLLLTSLKSRQQSWPK